METSEGGNRHRSVLHPVPVLDRKSSQPIDTLVSASSGGRFDDRSRQPRDVTDRPFKEGYTTATTSVLPPNHHNHSNQSSLPYPSSYLHTSAPPISIPAMLSPVDARRTSDESERQSRQSQSLPSFKDVILGAPDSYPPPPTGPAPAHPLPSPFTAPPPRAFSDSSSENRTSPRSSHPTNPFPPRSGPPPGFSGSARPPLSSRTTSPPPLPPFGSAHPSTQTYMERDRETDSRKPLEAGYSHYSQKQMPAHQHPTALYPQSGQLPLGQLPLPGISPASPRQPNSALPSPLETNRPPIHPDDPYGRNKYEGTLGRAFEDWNYLGSLNKVRTSRLLRDFC